MAGPDPIAAEIPLDAEGRLAGDLTCLRCGYNLRGLDPEGRCPECGTAVGRSSFGNLLRYCDPEWVRKLSQGMTWVIVAILLQIVFNFAAKPLGLRGPPHTIIQLAISAVSLIGFWLVTTPDPSGLGATGSLSARQLVRISQVLTFLSVPLGGVLAQTDRAIAVAVWLVVLIVLIAGFFAVFVYFRQLALRIPDANLASQTRIVMWGLVISFGVAMGLGVLLAAAGAGAGSIGIVCLGVVSLLAFAIWWLVLLCRYRNRLNEAARMARATWATDDTGQPTE